MSGWSSGGFPRFGGAALGGPLPIGNIAAAREKQKLLLFTRAAEQNRRFLIFAQFDAVYAELYYTIKFFFEKRSKMMSQLLQILGGFFFVILAFALSVSALLLLCQMVRVWTERRYTNIWHDLKSEGSYLVKNILWKDGGRIGFLIYYTEANACGYAIYECSTANVWTIPEEGDCLRPIAHSSTLPPFEIIRERNSV